MASNLNKVLLGLAVAVAVAAALLAARQYRQLGGEPPRSEIEADPVDIAAALLRIGLSDHRLVTAGREFQVRVGDQELPHFGLLNHVPWREAKTVALMERSDYDRYPSNVPGMHYAVHTLFERGGHEILAVHEGHSIECSIPDEAR